MDRVAAGSEISEAVLGAARDPARHAPVIDLKQARLASR
jgi:hypothetical protein